MNRTECVVCERETCDKTRVEFQGDTYHGCCLREAVERALAGPVTMETYISDRGEAGRVTCSLVTREFMEATQGVFVEAFETDDIGVFQIDVSKAGIDGQHTDPFMSITVNDNDKSVKVNTLIADVAHTRFPEKGKIEFVRLDGR